VAGGGFTGGSCDTTGSEDFVMSYLSEGVAFATIDNRLLESPEILEYRARVDMLNLMDAEDPPFYVDNYLEPASFPLTADLAFHHANHALVLADSGRRNRPRERGVHESPHDRRPERRGFPRVRSEA